MIRYALAAVVISGVLLIGSQIRQPTKVEAPPQAATAPAQPGTPFETAQVLDDKPGDNFVRYVRIGTPTAAMDAYRLVERCQRQRAYDPGGLNAELRGACDGITPEMERQAGKLLSTAMVAGVHEAALEYFNMVQRLSPEDIAEARKHSSTRAGLELMVNSLRASAEQDRKAVEALARLYAKSGPRVVDPDPVEALKYTVALQQVDKGPAWMEADRARTIRELEAQLPPDTAAQARTAGLILARSIKE